MSDHGDAKKEEKKDDKKAAAPAASGPKTGIKALIGPIAAVVLMVGSGIGIGMFLSNLITPPPKKAIAHGEGGAEGGDGHGAEGGDAHGAEGGDAHGAAGGDAHGGKGGAHDGVDHSLTHTYKEMVLDGVMANVKDTGGKKFVKINPVFWITDEAFQAAGLAGGGGHGGGGEPGGPIKRILRARLEERLREYDLDELTSKTIYKKLEKVFREDVEKEMMAVYPKLKTGKVVERVVVQGMMVQ